MTKNKKNAGTTESESPIMSGRTTESESPIMSGRTTEPVTGRTTESVTESVTKAIFVEPVSFLGHSLNSVTSLGKFNIDLKVIGNTTCLVLTPKDIVTAAQPVPKLYTPLSNVRYFETIA
jgi:hypothetical protein